MDVTALLNSHPAAAEQRKRADSGNSRTPSRNRTPWDAGGYSLPINTATHCSRTLQQQTQLEHQDGSQVNTPPSSPKHRFSDSRSSLSSFTSSLQSTTTHSRYSSTSTLNSNSHAHHKSFGTDILSPELRSISQALESAGQPLAIDSCQANDSQQGTSLSPTGSTLEQLALVAESHLSERDGGSSRRGHSEGTMSTTATNWATERATKDTSLNRPGSPSDAILIKRTSIPSLRVNTGNLNGYQQPINYLSAPLDRCQPSHLQNKTHKRTSSAPTFRPSTTSSLLYNTTPVSTSAVFNPPYSIPSSERNHLIMEKSSGVDHRVAMDDTSASHSKADNMTAATEVTSITSASASIGTSMVAGMNGNITLNISPSVNMNPTPLGPMAEPTPPSSQHPDHASPTSPPTYATPNTPPTLAPEPDSQTIVCMYIPNCDTGSQMRKAISHIFGRNKMCTRLIPQHVWVHYCRKHYQRSRYRNPKEYAKLQCDLVQEQIRRVHNWSEDNARHGRSGVVQDWSLAVRKREQKRIDDLERKESNKRKRSNVSAEDDEDDDDDLSREPPTAVPKWLQDHCQKQRYSTLEIVEIFNKLHREILSENNISTFPDLEILPNIIVNDDEPKSPKGYAKRSSAPITHRRSQSLGVVASSQPSIWGDEPSMHDYPSQKRRRPNSGGEDVDREFTHSARPRIAQRPIDGGRRIQHLAHRPMFAGIDEHQEYIPPRDGYFQHSPSSFQVPLPAPTPLRNTGYPLASQLENGGDFRRPSHGRSQSDVGFMHGQHPYMSTPSGFHHTPYGTGYPPYQGVGYHGPPRDHTYSPSTSRPPMPDMHAMSHYAPGHSRHQSTPIHPSYSSPRPDYQQAPQNFTAPPRREPLPSVHHIKEDTKTRELYSDRR